MELCFHFGEGTVHCLHPRWHSVQAPWW